MKNINRFCSPNLVKNLFLKVSPYPSNFKTIAAFLIAFLFIIGNILAQTHTISALGVGTFVVPSGVTQITVTVRGAGGGGGGNSTNSDGAGGGGGGGVARVTNYVVTFGNSINLFVGTGGSGGTSSGTNGAAGTASWFVNSTTLFANGGAGATGKNSGGSPTSGVAGGAAGGSITPTATFFTGGSGGNGVNNNNGAGGGGGSSAGTAIAGNNGTNATASTGGTGGTAPTGGFAGGNGGSLTNSGVTGSIPGGGGGGAGESRAGGAGGNGRIDITWTCPTVTSIAYTSPICKSSTSALPTLTGTAGGTYSSSAGLSINATTGAIDASTSTAGTYTVSYGFAAQTGFTANCPPATTTTNVTINAIPTATAGGSSTICSDATATVSDASSTNGTILWTHNGTGSISAGATTLTPTYTAAAGDAGNTVTLTMTVSNAPCSAATATYSVVVNAFSIGGTVAGGVTVCSGLNSVTLTLSGHTGTVVKWQTASDAAFTTPLDIANTSTSLTVINSVATTYCRAVVQSGVCTATNSSTGIVTVENPSVGGSIAGSATVCSGTNSTVLTLSGHTSTVVKWQSATDVGFSSPTDIIANTTTTLTATDLTATTFYRAVVQNGSICPTSNSSNGSVTVNPLLDPSVSIALTTGTNPTCSGSAVIFTATPVNGGTNLSYEWKKDGVTVGSTSNTYTDAGTVAGEISCIMTVGTDICVNTSTATTASSIALTLNTTPATALHFDGTNDKVELGNWFNYQVFTIEMWLKPGATQSSYADIIDNNHATDINWVCQSTGGNSYIFGANGAAVSFTLTADVWQHVALVKEDKAVRVYINGVLTASAYHPNAVNYNGAQSLRLGAWGGGERNWNGAMDDIKMWSRTLCADEIANHNSCELSGAQTGLVAHYKCNQGIVNCDNSSETMLTDETGSHNGTLNNFVLTGATSNYVLGTVSGACSTVGSSTLTTFYRDVDEDTFGDASGLTHQSCTPLSGFVADNTDCDDSDGGVHADCKVKVAAKAFIDGPYKVSTGLMNDGLRANGKIPLSQPYNTLISNGSTAYSGTETVAQSVLNVTGDNAIVDWVLIEMRDAANPSNVPTNGRRAALLQRDGDIVDVNGTSAVSFPNLPKGSYQVVIRHRLCLATRTNTTVNFLYSNTPSVNFTTNTNALATSQKLLATGIYGLYIGDTDRNGDISIQDLTNIRARNPTTVANFDYIFGYDLDFSASILSADATIVRINASKTEVNLNQ
jgi:hypothetical protein